MTHFGSGGAPRATSRVAYCVINFPEVKFFRLAGSFSLKTVRLATLEPPKSATFGLLLLGALKVNIFGSRNQTH